MQGKWRPTIFIVCSILVGVFTNVWTGALPNEWKPYFSFAWIGILTFGAIWLLAEFWTSRKLKVFVAHSHQDKDRVRQLAWLLKKDYSAWIDEHDLIAGQDWKREIFRAIEGSDVVLICLSTNSFNQIGVLAEEIRYAFEVLQKQSHDTIYIIPVRLDECSVPSPLNEYHWVSLFESSGYGNLQRAFQERQKQLDKQRRQTIFSSLRSVSFGFTIVMAIIVLLWLWTLPPTPQMVVSSWSAGSSSKMLTGHAVPVLPTMEPALAELPGCGMASVKVDILLGRLKPNLEAAVAFGLHSQEEVIILCNSRQSGNYLEWVEILGRSRDKKYAYGRAFVPVQDLSFETPLTPTPQ